MPNVTEIVFVVGPLASAPPWHREMEPHSGMGLGAARGPGCSQIHPGRLRMTNSKVGTRPAETQGPRQWLPAGRQSFAPWTATPEDDATPPSWHHILTPGLGEVRARVETGSQSPPILPDLPPTLAVGCCRL